MVIPRKETPVPISNTAVKLSGADGTIPAMEWESWLSRGIFLSAFGEITPPFRFAIANLERVYNLITKCSNVWIFGSFLSIIQTIDNKDV